MFCAYRDLFIFSYNFSPTLLDFTSLMKTRETNIFEIQRATFWPTWDWPSSAEHWKVSFFPFWTIDLYTAVLKYSGPLVSVGDSALTCRYQNPWMLKSTGGSKCWCCENLCAGHIRLSGNSQSSWICPEAASVHISVFQLHSESILSRLGPRTGGDQCGAFP